MLQIVLVDLIKELSCCFLVLEGRFFWSCRLCLRFLHLRVKIGMFTKRASDSRCFLAVSTEAKQRCTLQSTQILRMKTPNKTIKTLFDTVNLQCVCHDACESKAIQYPYKTT